jgi:BirA family biotin operon repressor/biotin-[acetyl-CoA-carboxylase] ligase
MTLPDQIFELRETGSTQDDAKNAGLGIFWTTNQTAGKGRFDRNWVAEPGKSLAISICLTAYKGHPAPHLIGMKIATRIARCMGAKVQWPNDIVLSGKKVGGILTELHNDIPIVGIGLNLNQAQFPDDIAHRATSFFIETGQEIDVQSCFNRLIQCLKEGGELTRDWSELRMEWLQYDDTPGKPFTLPNGEVGTAVKVGTQGMLEWTNGVVTEMVPVAEALWGTKAS